MKFLTYKLILASFLFVFASCSCISRSRPASSVPVGKIEVSLEVMKGVEVVIGSGSIFAISDEKYLSAYHVCEDEIDHPTHFNLYLDGNPLTVIKADKKKDLCLLYSNKKNLLKPLKIASDLPTVCDVSDPKECDKVWLIGFPLGVGPFPTDGRYVNLINIQEHMRYLLSLQAYGGFSGSPILNDDGEVVSMLVMGVPVFTQMSFGVTLSDIHSFLAE